MTVFPTRTVPHHRQIAGFIGRRTRNGEDSRRLSWLVSGAANAADAESHLLTNGLPASTIDFTPIGGAAKTLQLDTYEWREAVDGNDTAYIFDADYSFEKLDVDEYSLNIDQTAGTIRVTNAFDTLRFPANAPDFKGAIDVRDGKPQGVDRVLPAAKYTLTYRLSRPADPFAFADISEQITGTVNTNAMLGKQPGELLYLGATGDFGKAKDPELQFTWAVSRHATISIGDIASINKRGHDYLWVLYEDDQTGSGADAFVSSKPRAAYVERIYTEADHSILGLVL